MSYLKRAPTRRQTPQSQPIPGSGQVPNSAGGFAWKVDPLTRLRRFLILGAESGTYYISERELVAENVSALHEADPVEAIKLIVDVSVEGRAPKQAPTLFALAFYAAHPDVGVRRYALSRVPQVCRTGTMLFQFCEYVEMQRGWGRSLRRAIAGWYERENLDELAYQVVKYRQREGWSHKNLLRLARPAALSPGHAKLYDWIAETGSKRPEERSKTFVERYGETGADLRRTEIDQVDIPFVVEGFIHAQKAKTPRETAAIVREYNLPREAIKPEHLTSLEVWVELFERMPMTALIRNLPTMTRVGLIRPLSHTLKEVTARLTDVDQLRKARVHPIALLAAQLTYAAGHSARGSNEWSPVAGVTDALDEAFYLSFGALTPANKRFVLAIDTSASMTWENVAGVPGLTPEAAAAAMALVTAATEPESHIMAFSQELQEIDISPKDRLETARRKIGSLFHGGTDCSVPMRWATDTHTEVDCFVVLTDSETWYGGVHPSQALARYRQLSGVSDAALVVEAMVANEFSIADPNDARMLDVVGFDTSIPQVVSDFAAGRL